jgi:PAB1-binding protein PBP1
LSNNIDLHSFLSAADANSLVFTLCYARVKVDVLAIPKSRLELFVSDIVYVRAHEVEVFDPVSSITTSLCVEEDQTATIISTHPSIKNQTNNTTASITVDSDTFTDSGICRSRSSPHHSQAGVERELTPFVDFITPANTSIDLTLDETESIRDWDQFEANERLFGVQTTYHEDLYTIPLDRNSEVYKAHEALASQIEQEIVQQPSSNVHLAEERGQLDFTDMDDEERYSAVTRSTSGNLKNTKPFRPPSSPTQLNTTNTTSKHVSPLRGGRLQSQTQSQPPLPPQQQQQQQQQQQKLSREGSFITLSPTEQRENSSSHGDIASTSSVASNSKHNSSPAEQGTPVLQTISKVSSVSNMSQKMTRSCSQGSLVHRPRSKGSGQRTASLSGMGSKSPLLFVSPLHSRGSSPDLNAIAEWRKIRKQLNKSPGSPLSSPKQVLSLPLCLSRILSNSHVARSFSFCTQVTPYTSFSAHQGSQSP